MIFPLRSRLKKILLRLFPQRALEYFSARSRVYSHQLVEAWGCAALNEKLMGRWGSQVQQGPFKDLTLSPMARKEHLAPYLLGTYEKELNPAWEKILSGQYSQILDVGAKFGFYATGLARHFPGTEVIAFDTDPWARKATLEMAQTNGTPNVKVERFCDPLWLKTHLKENAFLLSDCEGYESVLFGSGSIPALATATLLIEIHDQLSPGASEVIRSQFQNTHTRMEIPSQPPSLHPAMEGLTEAEQALAGNEFRTAEQSWVYLCPKPPRRS